MTLEQRIARLELQLDKLSKGTPIRFGEAPPPELDLQGGQETKIMPNPEFKEEVISQDELHLGMQRDNIEAMQMAKAPAKDWEILEFRNAEGAKMRRIPGCSGFQFRIEGDERELVYPLNEMIGDKDWPIHSVRRLSDNKTWTIKDKCRVDGKTLSIDGFCLVEDGMFVDVGLITTPPLSALDLIRKPLFTTSDGVGIEEGAEVWELANGHISKLTFYKNETYSGELYSSEEAAKKACKLLFLSADGVEVYEGDTVYILWVDGKDRYTGRISMDPASEVDLDHLRKRSYSTEGAAQAAYEKWVWEQPILSYYDILNWHQTHGANYGRLKQIVKIRMASK